MGKDILKPSKKTPSQKKDHFIKKNKPFQDEEILSEDSQNQQPVHSNQFHDYESAEDVRKRISKQLLEQVEKKGQKGMDDDFFMQANEERKNTSNEIVEGDDEEVYEKYKQEYLRSNNKLYEECSSKFQNGDVNIGEAAEYKGHTKCITGIEVTDTHIYSCSKDRSIIKWDRETLSKDFISLGKDANHHQSDILCVALHSNENVIATGGEDCVIKLWDVRNKQLVDTLKSHKNNVNGIKFGLNSNNLCSVSSDLTLKQWDFAQRGLMETFYEHNAQVLDIDLLNADDFITSGNDHQTIVWKTEKETKIVLKGHDYAIDRVRSINQEKFITASQDGSINLWFVKKTKPVFKLPQAHPKGWICALDNLKQTNMFATGAIDRTIKLWAIEGELKGIRLVQQIAMKGIVTDLKIRERFIAATECDEHRLGRWVTDKCRNKIKVFPITS